MRVKFWGMNKYLRSSCKYINPHFVSLLSKLNPYVIEADNEDLENLLL